MFIAILEYDKYVFGYFNYIRLCPIKMFSQFFGEKQR
jgi:hypothetical protein